MTFSSTTLPKRAARLLFCAVFVQSLGAEPKCKNNKYWYDNFATNQMAYSQVIFGAAILLPLVSRPLFSVGLLLTSGGLLTIRWFNFMPHLSLFSFCDETLVPVIFSGRE